ncbi:hypothetical protein BM1_01865 [Bipolaris maydis]|nr:hypothetical protein BM1_01865 [Bipolaris maydis]
MASFLLCATHCTPSTPGPNRSIKTSKDLYSRKDAFLDRKKCKSWQKDQDSVLEPAGTAILPSHPTIAAQGLQLSRGHLQQLSQGHEPGLEDTSMQAWPS